MKYRLLTSSFVAIALLGLPAVAQEGKPDQTSGGAKAQDTPTKKKKREPIYDEKADAREQINNALAKAGKENRRVLIKWGANSCYPCHLLHDMFKNDKQIARKLLYEYDLVLIEVLSQADEFKDFINRYAPQRRGYSFEGKGIPYLTILDAEGEVVVNQATGIFETNIDGKTGHDPEKVLAFLTKHQATYLKAEEILVQGVNQASSDGKRVFVHFGAPWCGWCKRLEAWMAQEDVATVLGKYFVDVKIDVDRTLGGKELYQRLSEGKGKGIPWSAVLDENGDVVVGSFMEGDQNIGHPVTEEEIEAFLAMLTTGMDRLGAEDRTFLAASLIKARPKRNH